MGFETTEQFQAASMMVLRQIREDLAALRAFVEAGGFNAPTHVINGQAAQLELAGAGGSSNGNGHGPGGKTPPPAPTPEHKARTDPFGHELPRGVSWDASGEVWQVDVTLPGRPRRRVRVPADRFHGRPALGLAEACRVRQVLQGLETKANLAAMHPDTARDVAAATAP